MKTSGVATATPTEEVVSNASARTTVAEEGSNDAAPEAPVARWTAKDAEEARFCVRHMHRRVPAWKLKLCVDELNASSVDLTSIAEVTEIRFASVDLVGVAAQCLNEISKEIESVDVSAGASSSNATAAASCQNGQESTNNQPTSPDVEEEAKIKVEGVADEKVPHNSAANQAPQHSVHQSQPQPLPCHLKMPQHRWREPPPRRRTSQLRI